MTSYIVDDKQIDRIWNALPWNFRGRVDDLRSRSLSDELAKERDKVLDEMKGWILDNSFPPREGKQGIPFQLPPSVQKTIDKIESLRKGEPDCPCPEDERK